MRKLTPDATIRYAPLRRHADCLRFAYLMFSPLMPLRRSMLRVDAFCRRCRHAVRAADARRHCRTRRAAVAAATCRPARYAAADAAVCRDATCRARIYRRYFATAITRADAAATRCHAAMLHADAAIVAAAITLPRRCLRAVFRYATPIHAHARMLAPAESYVLPPATH